MARAYSGERMGSLNKGVLSYLKISGHNRAEHVHKDLVMTHTRTAVYGEHESVS